MRNVCFPSGETAHISTIGYLLISTIVRSVLNRRTILIGNAGKEGNSHFSLCLSLFLSLCSRFLSSCSLTLLSLFCCIIILLFTHLSHFFSILPHKTFLGDGGAEWTVKEKSNIKLDRTFYVSMQSNGENFQLFRVLSFFSFPISPSISRNLTKNCFQNTLHTLCPNLVSADN